MITVFVILLLRKSLIFGMLYFMMTGINVFMRIGEMRYDVSIYNVV